VKILYLNFQLKTFQLMQSNIAYRYELGYGILQESVRLGHELTMGDRRFNLAKFLLAEYKDFGGVVGVFYQKDQRSVTLWKKLASLLPVVNVMVEGPENNTNYVGVDEESGVRLLCEHFYDRGFRRFGFFSAVGQPFSQARFLALKKFLVEKKCEIFPGRFNAYTPNGKLKPRWVKLSPHLNSLSEKQFVKVIETEFRLYWEQAHKPQVLLFETDRLANYFFHWAKKNNIQVPADVAISGFDDSKIPMDASGKSLLTTVKQDFEGMGRMSVRLLHEIMSAKKKNGSQRILLKPDLIVRESSLAKTNESTSTNKSLFKKDCLQFLTIHYADKNVGKKLSQHFELRHSYFLVKFKEVFSKSFVSYLIALRVEKAAFEIIHTQKPITEILLDAGFHNHQSFNRAFKASYQVTPLIYRKQKSGAA
jgi:DNA-binding LacI/PurR family transcriptional regulator/AraC-like DNA-binding protein